MFPAAALKNSALALMVTRVVCADVGLSPVCAVAVHVLTVTLHGRNLVH